MSPHLSVLVLMCLSAVQLSVADLIEPETIPPRKMPLLGGWFEKSPDSEVVKEAAHQATKMFNDNHKSKKMFKLVSITSAQMQVTNKFNYKIVVILGKTKCLKREHHELNSCDLDKKRLRCDFRVTVNPHNDKHVLEHHSCNKPVNTAPPPTQHPPTPSA